MKCDAEDVKSAAAHLDGPEDPSWEEVTDFINELPNYSLLCTHWSDPRKKYSKEELRELTKQCANAKAITLEKVINEVDISS